MPNSQIDQQLFAVAQYEVVRARRPGVWANSMLPPYLQATVHFDPDSDIEVVEVDGSSSETNEIYKIFTKDGKTKYATDPRGAARLLFDAWHFELGTLDPMSRAQAIQAIGREYSTAPADLRLAAQLLFAVPVTSAAQAMPRGGSSSGSGAGGVLGCLAVIGLVALGIAVALANPSIGRALLGGGATDTTQQGVSATSPAQAQPTTPPQAQPTARPASQPTTPPAPTATPMPAPTATPVPAPTATPTPCWKDGGAGVTFYSGANFTGQSVTIWHPATERSTITNLPAGIAGNLGSFYDTNNAWHVVTYLGANGTGNLGHNDASVSNVDPYWRATQSVKVYLNGC